MGLPMRKARPGHSPALSRLGAVVALAAAVATFAGPAQAAEWRPYESERLSVDIPRDIFSNAGEASVAGTRFATADGRANLVIRSYPASPKSPAQFLAELGPPSHITYRRVTRRFFVVSSYRGQSIWYNRCNFSSRAVGCVLINYPASEKRRWDRAVTRISNSLRVL